MIARFGGGIGMTFSSKKVFLNPDVKLGNKFAFWEEVDGLPKVANRKDVQ